MMSSLLLLVVLSGGFPDSFIKMQTFVTDFHQKTTSPYFPAVEDDGILMVDGCKFRFEYVTNEKRITISDCSTIYQINNDEQVFKYSVKEMENNPFLKLLSDRESIKEDFVFSKISEKPVVYRLVPKGQNAETPFQVLKITLNKSETKMLEIEIIDENNQVILYKFTKMKKKKDIPISQFSIGGKNE